MSHPGIHEAFEAERKKQLTDKERETLSEALRRLAIYEREDVSGGLLKNNAGDLTYEELGDLCAKIFEERCP